MTASQEIQDSFDEGLKLGSQSLATCTVKRHLRSNSFSTHNSSAKRICRDVLPASTEVEAKALTKFSGFLTAGSNREIKVSEEALNLARARLCPLVNSVDESLQRSASSAFPGFVTAGSRKIIAVTEAALEEARRRLSYTEDLKENNINQRKTDDENLDPSAVSSLGESALKRTLAVSAPVTGKSSRNRFNSPFRAPDMVKPNLPGTPTSYAAADEDSLISGVSPRITCVRDLRCMKSSSTNFLGILIEDKIRDARRYANHPFIIKVADRYGEFLNLEMPYGSVPSGLYRGSVILVERALIKRWQGTISLIVTDSTFVDLEPHDPEAECLRRLFGAGLFDFPITEETFAFTGTALRLIARLDEYSFGSSTVMARISSIMPDNLLYLGCTVCRVLVNPTPTGLVSCQQCRNSKARYFYTLTAELADFSGVVTVKLNDDAARKLVGQPAGAMLKLTKEQLRLKFSKREFCISSYVLGFAVAAMSMLAIKAIIPTYVVPPLLARFKMARRGLEIPGYSAFQTILEKYSRTKRI